MKHFGLSDDGGAEVDYSFSLRGYGGMRGSENFFGFKIDFTFQIEGFSEKFGRTFVYWGKDFIASEKGAYWGVSDKICDGLKSALSLGTKSKPVELFFEDDFVVDYQFKPQSVQER